MIQRRAFVLGSAFALPLASVSLSSHAADNYPDKAITIYVAFGPGGAGDSVTRRVAQKISENIGKPVIVENRPGAGAAIAAASVKNATADGYAVLLTGNGSAISSVLFNHLPYSLDKDFRHVSSIADFDLAMIANGTSEFRSIADVIAWAKAHPGQMSIGTQRIGSTQHLAAELFKAMAGVQAVSVPYKSSGEMLTALRSNDVQLAFEIVPPILGQISSKTIRALGIASTRRFAGLPDVPTIAESGLPGFEATSWAGFSVVAKTPDAVVQKLSEEVQKAVNAPDVQKSLQMLGYTAVASTPEEMTERIHRDAVKWKAVIEKAGVPRQ